MNSNKLIKNLVDLNKKLEEIDRFLKEARIIVNDQFWDIRDSAKKKKT